MRRVIAEQRLGFFATVCPDGTPNVSPKGTIAVWDDDHLVFLDLASPQTVENLRSNPAIEVNVVDQVVRKGYRFKGTAERWPTGRSSMPSLPAMRPTATSPITPGAPGTWCSWTFPVPRSWYRPRMPPATRRTSCAPRGSRTGARSKTRA